MYPFWDLSGGPRFVVAAYTVKSMTYRIVCKLVSAYRELVAVLMRSNDPCAAVCTLPVGSAFQLQHSLTAAQSIHTSEPVPRNILQFCP